MLKKVIALMALLLFFTAVAEEPSEFQKFSGAALPSPSLLEFVPENGKLPVIPGLTRNYGAKELTVTPDGVIALNNSRSGICRWRNPELGAREGVIVCEWEARTVELSTEPKEKYAFTLSLFAGNSSAPWRMSFQQSDRRISTPWGEFDFPGDKFTRCRAALDLATGEAALWVGGEQVASGMLKPESSALPLTLMFGDGSQRVGGRAELRGVWLHRFSSVPPAPPEPAEPEASPLPGFTITVNGRGQELDARYYRIHPGRANRLDVVGSEAGLKAGEVELTLTKILPDGRRSSETRTISATSPGAEFSLGAFADPARYEFEAGEVFRRGTRFELTAAGRGGEAPVTVKFYQGEQRRPDSEALHVGELERTRFNSDRSGVPGRRLAADECRWFFRTDKNDEGGEGNWENSPIGSDWPEIDPGRPWSEVVPKWRGTGWYYLDFAPTPEVRRDLAALAEKGECAVWRFPEVDGDAEIFLNGELLARRSSLRWEAAGLSGAFDVRIPDRLLAAPQWRLVVRVAASSSGIRRRPRLLAVPCETLPRLGENREALPIGASWRQTKDDQGIMQNPPFEIFLSPGVLLDRDAVEVNAVMNSAHKLPDTPAVLTLRPENDVAGVPLLRREVTLTAGKVKIPVDVRELAAGRYVFELTPSIPGLGEVSGPRITYVREEFDPATFKVSPLAPWSLRRDESRAEIEISDFRKFGAQSADPSVWKLSETGAIGVGRLDAAPLVIEPQLDGYYALCAVPAPTSSSRKFYISAGDDDAVRQVSMSEKSAWAGEFFVTAADMTGGRITIWQSGASGSGVLKLRLVPVTAESVQKFRESTSHPPLLLAGAADWVDYFASEANRLERDQWDFLVKSHGEIGMRNLNWAVGRSTIYYHSGAPLATLYPSTPLAELPELNAKYPHLKVWETLMKKFCPLTEVERCRERYGVKVFPWLAMQRHYGDHPLSSRWFMDHPEYWDWNAGATKAHPARVSFFFPEVREERLALLTELALRDNDGVVIGCLRQPPMILRHPELLAEYRKLTGVDASQLDAGDGEAYDRFVRWRAEYFTAMLRELKQRLEPVRESTGRAIPVAVRVPNAGLNFNLAQSLDIETWLREKLVSRIELEALEDFGGRASFDVRPYLELGRRYGVPVLGGVNCNTLNPGSLAAGMHRALGLARAGVDGIQFYESNALSGVDPIRWAVSLMGTPDELERFLENSNLEACFPVRATNACAGFDNHSTYDAPSSYDRFDRGRLM